MKSDDTDEKLRRELAEEAARWKAQPEEEAKMPRDPSLGEDALFLADLGMPSAQWLKLVMLGVIADPTAAQLAAARALVPLEHKAQASKVETSITANADVMLMAQAMRAGKLTLEDLDAMDARAAEYAKRVATAH